MIIELYNTFPADWPIWFWLLFLVVPKNTNLHEHCILFSNFNRANNFLIFSVKIFSQ